MCQDINNVSKFISDGPDVNEQFIIIEDPFVGAASASFKRQVKKYKLRNGFCIDRENLLSKQQATLLVLVNVYNPSISYVTLEFKTLDGEATTDVRRVELKDDCDAEISVTVPTNLSEISCQLDASVGDTKLNISHSFQVKAIDACAFIVDVFSLPNNRKDIIIVYVLVIYYQWK